MYTKEELIKEIRQIRKEIGHEDIEVEIKEIHYHNDELTIITPDRPEKSIIIGKGGWVVGKLREKLRIKSIHIITYTDLILKEYQLELSIKHVKTILDKNSIPPEYIPIFKNMYELLNLKKEQVYNKHVMEDYIKKNFNKTSHTDAKAYIALSGGVDSSFSTILSKALGFNITTLTVNPGTIILPNKFRRNIKNLTDKIGVKQEYIDTDMSPIIKEALDGNIHPCGRCSKHIENTITEKIKETNIPIMIFGDLLSTGKRSIIIEDNIIRINLPALFRMEKNEIRNIIQEYNVEKIRGYGCPLIVQVHNKYPQYKIFSIQRVLRETRSGILEPGEALELIKTI